MRVWRSVELDRIGTGHWRLRWRRDGLGRLRGAREEAEVTGQLWTVLRIVPELIPKLNRHWWLGEQRRAAESRPQPLPGGGPDVRHRDGVWWHEAPIPGPEHECSAQTSGWVGLMRVERCACGATRLNGRGWFDRNTRTRGGPQ